MEAAIQRMNEILQNVHEPSDAAGGTSVASTEEQTVTSDSASHEETETFYDAECSVVALQNENSNQIKQEVKTSIEATSTSGDLSPNPFLVDWPWVSLVFTSSWWQELFGGDKH